MRQAITYGVNTGNRRREFRASRIPAEQIVVARGFSARRFDVGQAGQQTPIEFVVVGGFEKGGGVLFGGAVGVAEERAKGCKSGIVAIIRRRRRIIATIPDLQPFARSSATPTAPPKSTPPPFSKPPTTTNSIGVCCPACPTSHRRAENPRATTICSAGIRDARNSRRRLPVFTP